MSADKASPRYHVFERNTNDLQYTYGIDVFLESWSMPTNFDPILLVPGRAFYLWPLLVLAAIPWMRTRGARIGLAIAEICLALGGVWWVQMAAFMATGMRGLWVATAALAVFAAAAITDLGRAIRRKIP